MGADVMSIQKRIDRLWSLLYTCEDNESYVRTMFKIQQLQEQLDEEEKAR